MLANLLLIIPPALRTTEAQAHPKPNIIFILADDLGIGDAAGERAVGDGRQHHDGFCRRALFAHAGAHVRKGGGRIQPLGNEGPG
jgi:hypothetical protein